MCFLYSLLMQSCTRDYRQSYFLTVFNLQYFCSFYRHLWDFEFRVCCCLTLVAIHLQSKRKNNGIPSYRKFIWKQVYSTRYGHVFYLVGRSARNTAGKGGTNRKSHSDLTIAAAVIKINILPCCAVRLGGTTLSIYMLDCMPFYWPPVGSLCTSYVIFRA